MRQIIISQGLWSSCQTCWLRCFSQCELSCTDHIDGTQKTVPVNPQWRTLMAGRCKHNFIVLPVKIYISLYFIYTKCFTFILHLSKRPLKIFFFYLTFYENVWYSTYKQDLWFGKHYILIYGAWSSIATQVLVNETPAEVITFRNELQNYWHMSSWFWSNPFSNVISF